MILTTQNSSFNIETDISKIPYNVHTNFKKAEQRYFDDIKNDRIGNESIKDAVRCLIPNIDDLEDYSLSSETLPQLLDEGFLIDASTDELSIERIYAHYVNMVQGYFFKSILPHLKDLDLDSLSEKKKNTIKHIFESVSVGQTELASLIYAEMIGKIEIDESKLSFNLSSGKYSILKDRAIRLLLDRGMKTKEVVLVNYFRKLCEDGITEHGDDDGNMSFALGVFPVAVLCPKIDEILPSTITGLEKWAKARAVEFGDELTLDIVLNVSFFLRKILETTTKTRFINIFLEDSKWKNQAVRAKNGVTQKQKQRKEVMKYLT